MTKKAVRAGLQRAAVVAVVCGMGLAAAAQQGRQYTFEDYAQAERFMNYKVNPLVYHGVRDPQWMADGRFWYRDFGPNGLAYVLVDPVNRTKVPAFDLNKLTAQLAAAGEGVTPGHEVSIDEIEFTDSDKTVIVTTGGRRYRCGLSGTAPCVSTEAPQAKGMGGRRGKSTMQLSPDKTKAAFIRDYNLWVVDMATGAETQLTTDGVKDFGYATDNAGWTHSDIPIVLWSPDSKKNATFQQDQRKDGEMYLVPVTDGHPKLEAWKYPLPGDANVTMIERVVIDVGSKKIVRLKMPPDQHRSSLCDDVACHNGDTTWDDVQWSGDGKHLAFVSTARDHKQEWMRVADTETGDVRDVMNEKVAKFFESGQDRVNWRYLPVSNELLWFSERDGWGQMYLYDLTTGQLKNQITHGEGNVTQVLHVDDKERVIYFLAVGKEPGRDPYFSHFYRVNFDGSGLKLLTPENADHAVTPSLDGRYFVDVASTPTQPQVTVVRDNTGNLVLDVAKQDIRKLQAVGWKPLTQFTVKARDGKTDIYGFMFKPTHLDEKKKYPIVDFIYPGPQTNSCGSRSFSAAHRDMQALAELGFVVVCIDGMGTSWRSKEFHEAYYGDMGDNTIPDQVAGIKELAQRFRFIDADLVGIYGHSGGGYATASAMFHFPDFFKVGIAESGNHDNREYEDDWGEKWQGLLEKNPDGTTNYDNQANENVAKNLKGHLLLAHGTMDDNVPMNNTLLVVDALIKANRDFDLLLIPNAAHGYGQATPYMMRRRWDYFVRYLQGATPPPQFEMTPWSAAQAGAAIGGPSDVEEY